MLALAYCARQEIGRQGFLCIGFRGIASARAGSRGAICNYVPLRPAARSQPDFAAGACAVNAAGGKLELILIIDEDMAVRRELQVRDSG
jgi:hypothetical protein